jgi:membrane protease YdiL (CAAX protease family)
LREGDEARVVLVGKQERIWPAPQNVSKIIDSSSLGWKHALTTLLIIWTFAAFGEELSHRGYLLTRAADILGRSAAAYDYGDASGGGSVWLWSSL